MPKSKAAQTWQPSVYLGIEPDGTVKIVAHHRLTKAGRRAAMEEARQLEKLLSDAGPPAWLPRGLEES